MRRNLTVILLLAAGCLSPVIAQPQTGYVRDVCLKTAPGKSAEFGAFLRDSAAKRMQARVDGGQAVWWLVLSTVVPAGTAAMCDYHLVWGYNGFPPEAPTPEQDAAEMKKAGITMTLAAYEAKRDWLATLANVDIWRVRGDAGASAAKGQYVRLT